MKGPDRGPSSAGSATAGKAIDRRKGNEMNCANHPEAPAVAFCRTCGKPLCQVCQRPAQGTIFCDEHVAAAAPAAATSATAASASTSTLTSTFYRLFAVHESVYGGNRSRHVPRSRVSARLDPGRGRDLQRAICQGHYSRADLRFTDQHHQHRRGGRRIRAADRPADRPDVPVHGLRGLSHGQKAPARRTDRRILQPVAAARPRATVFPSARSC